MHQGLDMRLKRWQWDLLLFILASPFLLIEGMLGMWRRLRVWRLTLAPTIRCRTCHYEIVLFGFWRCRCGFTYQGHLLRYCPVCGSWPVLVRCARCGATETVRP